MNRCTLRPRQRICSISLSAVSLALGHTLMLFARRHQAYMAAHCGASCGCPPSVTVPAPDPACQDKDTTGACSHWAANGECEKNPSYMKLKCAHPVQLVQPHWAIPLLAAADRLCLSIPSNVGFCMKGWGLLYEVAPHPFVQEPSVGLSVILAYLAALCPGRPTCPLGRVGFRSWIDRVASL